MARGHASAYCSPYGAYELKATYQRNLGYGMLVAVLLGGAVSLALSISFASAVVVPTEPTDAPRDSIIVSLPPPISIVRPVEPVKPVPPQPDRRGGEIRAIADSLMIDEGDSLLTQNQIAAMQPGDVPNLDSGTIFIVPVEPEEFLPARDSLVIVEELPVMVHTVEAEYPRMARQMGMTGSTVIQALVGKNGDVLDVAVAKSSGTTSLDDAAVAAAWHYRYKPAIQNGRSVACWVSYVVEFDLVP